MSDSPVNETAAAAEPAAAPAPKRPRRSTSVTIEAEPAAPAPARRPRTKRAVADEAPSNPSGASRASDSVSAAGAVEAVPTDAAPRRGRPRRSTKATGGDAVSDRSSAPASADAGASSAPASAADSVVEAPRPRRGRPPKALKAAEEAARAAASSKREQPAASDAPASAGKKRPGSLSGTARNNNGGAAGQRPNASRNNNRQNNNGNGNRQANGSSRHQRQQRHNNREFVPSVTREDLAALKVADLRAKATELEVDFTGLKKAELIEAVFAASVKAEGFLEVSGILDILADGYGFLRTQGYLPGESDCYVGLSLIKRNGLRKGDLVVGQTRPARENEKYAAIQKIISVNGVPVDRLGSRPRFADLTPVYPQERLLMEHGPNTITARVIDLVAPIGKGQRGLIVSPPKAGKTTILKDIAASISSNNPEVHLMCLLVDERPEEVTDMQRSIKGEVISSTFDMPAENHIAVAEMVIERAKRLVECGKDVVILLDSITRLARAYNLAQPASGRVLSGGVDSTALYPPKRFLGAARNIEHGGSLTILASALIETGSKMDEVIFEEFKGTGNMELRLDRSLADRRVFPAIDPVASGTRKEELLMDSQITPLIWAVRRILANMNNTERAMDMLIKSLKQTETNQEFIIRTARKAQHSKSETLEV